MDFWTASGKLQTNKQTIDIVFMSYLHIKKEKVGKQRYSNHKLTPAIRGQTSKPKYNHQQEQ